MKRLLVGLVVCSVVALPWLSGTSFAQAATDVACAQCVDSSDLANDSIGSAKIKDASLSWKDLAENSVKAANINAGAVTFNKLATGVRDQLDASVAILTTETFGEIEFTSASAQCPSEKLIVSAACACDNNGGSSNDGVLSECWTQGNAAFATCKDDWIQFNPSRGFPLAIAKAVCLGAISSDGTPWLPTASGLATMDSENADETALRHSEWLSNSQTEYGAKLEEQHRNKARLELHRQR
jgi:hypothetical protein